MSDSVLREPVSIDPLDWSVYADFLGDDCGDAVGEARARRIAETLASGRTRLVLCHRWKDILNSPWAVWVPEIGCTRSRLGDLEEWRWFTLSGMFGRDSVDGMDCLAAYPLEFNGLVEYRPDIVTAFFSKLAELGPFLFLTGSHEIAVPAAVGVCPECSAPLMADVVEWERETGQPTQVIVDCTAAWMDDGPGWRPSYHHYRQSDWQAVRNAVEQWVIDNVRVKECN